MMPCRFASRFSLQRTPVSPRLLGRGSSRSSRRGLSDNKPPPRTEQEQLEYLRDANQQMQKYHQARELFKEGKLPSQIKKQQEQGSSSRNAPNSGTITGQLAVAATLVAAFFAMPLLGKKIATDEDFRQAYVPSWYDFTVKKPEKPWTRQELHQQMLEVQADLRQRAVQGDFEPQKLQDMQRAMQAGSSADSIADEAYLAHRAQVDRASIPAGWDRIHPGVEPGEKVHED